MMDKLKNIFNTPDEHKHSIMDKFIKIFVSQEETKDSCMDKLKGIFETSSDETKESIIYKLNIDLE